MPPQNELLIGFEKMLVYFCVTQIHTIAGYWRLVLVATLTDGHADVNEWMVAIDLGLSTFTTGYPNNNYLALPAIDIIHLHIML